MSFLDDIKILIHKKKIKLVLSEPEDIRVLTAVSMLIKEDLCNILLVGNPDKINTLAKQNNLKIEKAQIINPENFDRRAEFVEKYYELRKHKNISIKDAETTMKDTIFFGAMLTALWDADCFVAGCINPTSKIVKAAIEIIKPASGIKTVSSSTIHILNNTNLGENGILFFSDTSVVPDPTAEQLADIAISAATKWEKIMKTKAKVAMLSFSTKGSAKHPLIDKVIKATKIAMEKNPEFLIDGELQADAAIIPEIGKYKAKQSKIAGQANVLVFPDLNSGNIAYKLVERTSGTIAIGPILQGLSKPCSDLSRGCSAQDIFNISIIVASEALKNRQ